jgi:hypothetical protein
MPVHASSLCFGDALPRSALSSRLFVGRLLLRDFASRRDGICALSLLAGSALYGSALDVAKGLCCFLSAFRPLNDGNHARALSEDKGSLVMAR